MKFISSLVALLCAVVVTSCTDAKALTIEDMTVSYSVDSMSIRVPIKVPVGADSAVVTLTLVPGGAKTLKATPQTTALVFTFSAAAYGQPFTAQACGKPWWGKAGGASSCNRTQTFTRRAPSDTLTWPDSMTLSQMHWPDAASLALIEAAWADALPLGPLVVVRGADTLYRAEWAVWGHALLIRPAAACASICRQALLTDTFRFSIATDNWRDIQNQTLAFDRWPRHRAWWDATKACGGCLVILPPDSTAPGVKL